MTGATARAMGALSCWFNAFVTLPLPLTLDEALERWPTAEAQRAVAVLGLETARAFYARMTQQPQPETAP